MTINQKRNYVRAYLTKNGTSFEKPVYDMTEQELDFCIRQIKRMEERNKEREDVVNHPSHYTNGGMECFDEMRFVFGDAVVANFCLCNAWKYRYRALYKNGEEDMKKSHWYMNKYKELTSNE